VLMIPQVVYDQVAAELERKQLKPGLWARALAEMGDGGEKARAYYIKLRAEEIHSAANPSRQNAPSKKSDAELGLGARVTMIIAGLTLTIWHGRGMVKDGAPWQILSGSIAVVGLMICAAGVLPSKKS
jgi:hypothetical protein